MQLGLSIRDPCLPFTDIKWEHIICSRFTADELKNNELIYSLLLDVHTLGFQPHLTVETTLYSNKQLPNQDLNGSRHSKPRRITKLGFNNTFPT